MDVTHVLWGMRQLRHDFYILEIGRPVDADFFFASFRCLIKPRSQTGNLLVVFEDDG
jgi:hypothetical protein